MSGRCAGNLNDLPRIGLALALVAIAALISRWQQADLETDLLTASVRGFVQLIAVGYLLELVFNQDEPCGRPSCCWS